MYTPLRGLRWMDRREGGRGERRVRGRERGRRRRRERRLFTFHHLMPVCLPSIVSRWQAKEKEGDREG